MLICPIYLLVKSLFLPLSTEYLNKKKYVKFQDATWIQIGAYHTFTCACVCFKLILGWAENTRMDSVAPVKIKMVLLCETALLYFSVEWGYHPYVFHWHYPLREEKCMTDSKWRSVLGKDKDESWNYILVLAQNGLFQEISNKFPGLIKVLAISWPVKAE